MGGLRGLAGGLGALLLLSGALGEDCVVETQKCNFPFSSPSGELHYSCQATNGSISGSREGFFCRSQIGAEGRERHTYGLCNGGCYEDDEVTPLDFTEDDIMSLFCSTAASPCQFPFTWNGTEYRSCTKDGVDGQYAWCALQVDANGVLVKDRWGACNMDTCAEQMDQFVFQPIEAIVEFTDSLTGVVKLNQKAPDNPVEIRGQLEGLPEGHYKLRASDKPCGERAEGKNELLSTMLGSDGTSASYVSSEEWTLALFAEGQRLAVSQGSLVIQEAGNPEAVVSCANIVREARRSLLDDTSYLIIILVAAALLLLLILAALICCCWRSRHRGKEKISGGDRDSIEDIYLGSRSKSPLFDELSIPFIDASLPPTPKTGRSQNALEILLGRRSLNSSDASLTASPEKS